ncbi:protein nrt1/ ptr family 5.12 [Phtheirospermum japonicum]|uniref:Protein nrt1/ ptr family 5.12 n=1 Tax=Phtheirospermum japonicum TaxID=374723 RepID=A0A830CH41_9LAMI|nr:protein nrt1/ ptr family 5.12 [Phtheirospermum japonicum]
MSVCWLAPQYSIFGISEAFTMVGLQEFFYDQVPNDLRSIGLALYLKSDEWPGKDSWFSDNLNQAHLDYFYWLLSGLSAVAFVAYVYFAKSYIYNRKGMYLYIHCVTRYMVSYLIRFIYLHNIYRLQRKFQPSLYYYRTRNREKKDGSQRNIYWAQGGVIPITEEVYPNMPKKYNLIM